MEHGSQKWTDQRRLDGRNILMDSICRMGLSYRQYIGVDGGPQRFLAHLAFALVRQGGGSLSVEKL